MSIGIEVEGNVGIIEMQTPPHNFLTYQLVESIADALEGFDAGSEVRAAVLCAEGRSFCAGANFGGGPAAEGGRREPAGGPSTARLYAAAARLCAVATPFVAAVHGPAIGGGLGLAMVATLRVTCPDARFSANFAALGIHPGFGLSVTVPEVIGPSRAAEVLLTAKRYKGDEAMAIGLADRCVPADQVRAASIALAGEIAVNAPLAVRSIHRTLRRGLADRVRQATEHEAAEQLRLSATEDAREGMRAVNERRSGDFAFR